MDAARYVMSRGREAGSGGGGSGDGSPLRLRRGPSGSDAVESVLETFLGARDRAGEAVAQGRVTPMHQDERPEVAAASASGRGEAPVIEHVKPLQLRCPHASAVVIGVEPTGRMCLEVHVGTGAGVRRVLSELEEAERWLRSSAHEVATSPVSGRVDMSQPARKRIVADQHAGLQVGLLCRAGVEVRECGCGEN